MRKMLSLNRILLCSHLLAFLFAGYLPTQAQVRKPVKDVAPYLDSSFLQLKQAYGRHKKIPARYEKEILLTLSYFPDLKNTHIRFKLRKNGLGLSSRPAWGSVIIPRKWRHYIVNIGDDAAATGKWAGLVFGKANANAQVGVLGHELTHIMNFNRAGAWKMLRFGWGHLSKRYMDRFEYNTDSLCILQGLGYQLLAWHIYLAKSLGIADPENAPDPFYGDFGHERYMSPASIRRVMRKTPAYGTE